MDRLSVIGAVLGTFAAWIGREIFGGFADLLEDTAVVVQVGGEAAFLPARHQHAVRVLDDFVG